MSSAGLANLPAVTAANHAVLTIENELVYVTAHTAAATTATIQRGKEGTSAASHGLNVAWVHGPVASDYDSVLGYAPVMSTQAGIATTDTALTGLTVTVTVPYAQHRVRISAYTEYFSATANNTFVTKIKEGSTRLSEGVSFQGTAGNGIGVLVVAVVVPSAGVHTYFLAGSVTSGTSTLNAAADLPSFILVEDLGPAL